MQGRLHRAAQVLVLALIMGFTAGAGLAINDLSEFSRIPATVSLLLPLLAGLFIGTLTPYLSQAIGTMLLAMVISVLVSTLALAFPEFQVNRLGLDIALELSIAKALRSVIVTVPLITVGLLLGKIIVRD